jgi:S-formylglutathione hydrolase FrmB
VTPSRLSWRSLVAIATLFAATFASSALAQRGRVVVDTVRAESLRNRIGDPARARVRVYLPPSYGESGTRRYPVIYLLHGAGNTDRSWMGDRSGFAGVPAIMDSLIRARAVQDMIVVMPNATNRLGASWYLNSSTTGRWEDFISGDLVRWTDARFRTIVRPEGRGIAGASMGGFGALMIAMRHGDAFSAAYAASPCCTDRLTIFDVTRDRGAWNAVAAVASYDDLRKATSRTRLLLSLAAAFIPDSTTPPLYFAFPFERRGDRWVANSSVLAQWDANVPIRILPAHAAALRRLRALQLDHGRNDATVSIREALALDSALTRAQVPHGFELYDGGHFDRPTERLATKIFPFFSKAFGLPARSVR